MEYEEMNTTIEKLFEAIEKLIPLYMQEPLDRNIANGNVAVCIIDDKGRIHGKMFGSTVIFGCKVC